MDNSISKKIKSTDFSFRIHLPFDDTPTKYFLRKNFTQLIHFCSEKFPTSYICEIFYRNTFLKLLSIYLAFKKVPSKKLLLKLSERNEIDLAENIFKNFKKIKKKKMNLFK